MQVVFSDENDKIMQSRALGSAGKLPFFWSIATLRGDILVQPVQITLHESTDSGHSFYVEGIKIDNGWTIKDEHKIFLILEAKFAEQMGNVSTLRHKETLSIASGFPSKIAFEEGCLSQVLHGQPLSGNFCVMDKWDNVFVGQERCLELSLNFKIRDKLQDRHLTKKGIIDGNLVLEEFALKTSSEYSVRNGHIEWECALYSNGRQSTKFNDSAEFSYNNVSVEFEVPSEFLVQKGVNGIPVLLLGTRSTNNDLGRICVKVTSDKINGLNSENSLTVKRLFFNEIEDASKVVPLNSGTGKSAPLSAFIKMKESRKYVAEIGGLETTMEVRVQAGMLS